MSPLNVNLTDLITDIDTELADADGLAKISEAQRRSHTLADLGDQLVDHYVTRARSSGVSWSQIGDAIGVSKQAAQQRWVPPVYERFTVRARDVLVRASDHARRYQHATIAPEHLFLALLDDPDGLAAKIVARLAGDIDRLRDALGNALVPGERKSPAKLPYDPMAKRIVAQTGPLTAEFGHNYVGTEHILLAFVIVMHTDREAPYLDRAGLTVEAVRAAFVEELAGYVKAHPEKAKYFEKAEG